MESYKGTLQGHRYLGSGNTPRNGDPVEEDDGIFKSHDNAYERATSHEDVFAADQASAALFLNDFRRTDNWHSALGAVGLGMKNIVEQYVVDRSLYGMPGTDSSVVQPVNSDMQDYGLSSVGLNHSLDTGMCCVMKGETNNPMKPQSYTSFQEKDQSDLAKSYWGLKITPGKEERNGDDETSIPACIGVPRPNIAYDFIHIDKVSHRLTNFVNHFSFKGHMGTPIVNVDYQFGCDAWLNMGSAYNTENELLTRTQLGLPTEVLSYTTSNLSSYESYVQKLDLNVTMRLRPSDMHTRPVKYLDLMENA
ncbi:hypothetical protein HPB51_022537 [Rhipicephalus microplus]|uniref:Uncharacterized protein n=1 Tax=Rhipicephalus microplus TaxID=6941 RepID=A0A9J6E4T9_RHIMP|nr:hypothetical protein HPB51_022537 [Rhipicephalus microplus]